MVNYAYSCNQIQYHNNKLNMSDTTTITTA